MPDDYYESEKILREYLLFHYGTAEDLLPWEFGPRDSIGFPERCVNETVDWSAVPDKARALDLGCAVGGAGFALSRHCAAVLGIDFSAAFIQAARRLASRESIAYGILETGERYREAVARAPENAFPERVRFEVGDAEALRPDLGRFDVVLACNLLCRLRRPQRLLARLSELVAPGGQLVLTTPNTWLETFTAKEYWLGATPETGEPFEALRAALEPGFTLRRRLDLPFLIREHRRKYQWSVAEATVWQRQIEG